MEELNKFSDILIKLASNPSIQHILDPLIKQLPQIIILGLVLKNLPKIFSLFSKK